MRINFKIFELWNSVLCLCVQHHVVSFIERFVFNSKGSKLRMTETISSIDEAMPLRNVEFVRDDGSVICTVSIPIEARKDLLDKLMSAFLQTEKENEVRYDFYHNQTEITTNIKDVLTEKERNDHEKSIVINVSEEVPFHVRPVTRCTSSLSGHSESVISARFSPNSMIFATGSGDTTVRLWDIFTETPYKVLEGHKDWVLCLDWSSDGQKLASGDKKGVIIVWNPETGEKACPFLRGHKSWITSIKFQPYHLDAKCDHLASASKDCDIRLWHIPSGTCLMTFSGHTKSVTCIQWGLSNTFYSGSQDQTIKKWEIKSPSPVLTLKGHGHWINSLSLNVDYFFRKGPFDIRSGTILQDPMAEFEKQKSTLMPERLVSASDDMTLFLWMPDRQKDPIARMTGHQQPVSDVKFSPDGKKIASSSFDKSVRLWNGLTGQIMHVFRGHVQGVYVISWSSDSRKLISGSSDSTMKIWDTKMKKLEVDLPGHGDEVYAVDWAINGTAVASGGKDKLVKIWRC